MNVKENSEQKKIQLNLGSGNNRLSGYINIDSREECNPDLVCDVRKLPYKENTISRILANDILEHVGRNEVRAILRHWYDVLEIRGILIIKTPNLDTIIDFYKAGKISFEETVRKIYGQQDNEGNYHYTAFNSKTLYNELMYTGFRNIGVRSILPGADWSNMAVRCQK